MPKISDGFRQRMLIDYEPLVFGVGRGVEITAASHPNLHRAMRCDGPYWAPPDMAARVEAALATATAAEMDALWNGDDVPPSLEDAHLIINVVYGT